MEVIEWIETREEFSEGSPSIDMTQFIPASRVAIITASVGWKGAWHATPKRQLMFYLAGSAKRETSDGSIHDMNPGTITLLEDIDGKGHRSWVVGDSEVVIALVQLDSDEIVL